ncbi:hypothetical protein AMJ86_05970 [bacterium SM23_57]|nr:MAG: hypothetical protein AMJ86_05970 [bacterium SM23_57]
MDQRIVEILIYLIGEIQSRRLDLDEVEVISDDLVKRGFTENEISTAITYLFDRVQKRDYEWKSESEQCYWSFSERVLHDVERMVLTPDAYGYLLQLKHLGLIDALELEQIIERSLLMGIARVGLDDIKIIVASFLFDHDSTTGDMRGMPFFLKSWRDSIH